MSAVSPGPEEACPGSVRPPVLCTLFQAAHQVDWRSSDRPQPCEMQPYPYPNALPLTGHASCLCSPLGMFCTQDQLLYSDSSLT